MCDEVAAVLCEEVLELLECVVTEEEEEERTTDAADEVATADVWLGGLPEPEPTEPLPVGMPPMEPLPVGISVGAEPIEPLPIAMVLLPSPPPVPPSKALLLEATPPFAVRVPATSTVYSALMFMPMLQLR